MIDLATYERFLVAEHRARTFGLSLAETLDADHILLTAKRSHDISLTSVENIQRRLERQNPNKLMAFYYGRTDGTPAEMFEALKKWVHAVVQNQANKTLEDL